MITHEQHTNYMKGTCYTTSGDKTSFEQNEWHGFSKDGYSSSVYVPMINEIIYDSAYIDSSGNISVDREYLTFDHNVGKFYFEIIEEPSSSSYEYKVAASTVGYDELCKKVAEYAENNVARLSGYTMDKLTKNADEADRDTGCAFMFQFLAGSHWDAATWYNTDFKYFGSYTVSVEENYYIKKDKTS